MAMELSSENTSALAAAISAFCALTSLGFSIYTVCKTRQYERHMKYLKQLQISVPILAEQKKAVADVEKYEVEIAKVATLLPTFAERKRAVLLKHRKE